ncbi:MAG: endolytic transglycosylase MltG [Propionibacteriaceae bacterium]|nr:endolytic transglycosylase MltG [Propionibacteriaceae bacterium]
MTEPRRARQRDRLRDPETGKWDMPELRHRLKGWAAVLVALAVVIGGGWFVGTRAWDAFMEFRTQEDYIGAEGVADVEVDVPSGSTMSQIGQLLEDADVVQSADTFLKYARTRPDEAATVQAGNYRMRTQISAEAAFDRLVDPSNIVRNTIQLREGQRVTEQVALMAELTGLPQSDFEAILADPGPLELPGWAENRPEGFLFPDTYEVGKDPSALDVMKTAVNQFKRVAEEIDFENKAAASPAGDPYRALTMASLLEREAVTNEDRVKVARVFYNRLAQGMPLQSDATVAYANNITGRVFTTQEERNSDSPYNTYKVTGWIPGPITSPARAAMEAAVNPAEGDWLYFVVVNLDTGETEFNNNLADHNASAEKLQVWCRTQAPGRCQ